ncbi:MAG: helix-turn-helix transcriptional regulator [Planctomycetaceae bacterium]|nr:helix-turn-helix transcriptional regulator [Planctomycetaceae bacterium]
MRIIVEKIEAARIARGLTSCEMERRAELYGGRMTKWRKGQGSPKVSQLLRIAAVLEVHPLSLLPDGGSRTAAPTRALALAERAAVLEVAGRIGVEESLTRLLRPFLAESRRGPAGA